MTTRDDVIARIRAVDARLDALRDRIIAGGERPLSEGTWRVRDALSHLAARANGIDRVVKRLQATEAGTPPPPPRSIDDINAGQVEERAGANVAALLDEIRAGHAAAIAAIGHVDDATLAKTMPIGYRPGDAAVVDLMMGGGPGHDLSHVEQIEAALS